jgi:putative aldouronate transport system substrate-binding protein
MRNWYLFSYNDPGIREYFRFMNRLYNAGLLHPEYFTGSVKEMDLAAQGNLAYWDYLVNANIAINRGGILQTLKSNYPDADFVSIPFPINMITGEQLYVRGSSAAGMSFIPKTSKNPEAAMKYLNWLSTQEGGFTLYHGFEGEHFEYIDGVPIPKDSEYNARTKDYIRDDLFLVGNNGYYLDPADFVKVVAKEVPGYEQYAMDNYRNSEKGTPVLRVSYSSPTESKQNGNLLKLSQDYSVKITTCKPNELDAIFDEYLAEMERYDVEEITEERREFYRENY